MAKRVVVIASGKTEQLALPHLLSHLRDKGICVQEVRIPPRNKPLDVGMAESLAKAVWYFNPDERPDKFVVLVDADGHNGDEVVRPFQEQLPRRLGGEIDVPVLCAYAQWHLEAWYFADADNLRAYLGGRALGPVDTSKPDEIQSPKNRLKNLLESHYTAQVAEEIAQQLNALTIAQRSPSFKGFREAVVNGSPVVAEGAG